MTIPTYRLPEGIERGSGFGPTYKNVIQEAISGNEQRFAQWTKCRGVGDLSFGLLTSADPMGDFRAILAMWRAHVGSIYPWRFRDWSDYTATNENFGTGNGSAVAFQLTMTYDPGLILLGVSGALRYIRNIALLDGAPLIKIDGVTASGYTINSAGIVTFATAPASSKPLTWTGTFDVPVRFDTNQLSVIMNEADLASIRSIPIREVIGES